MPITVITPAPGAWKEALRLAGGDARRCVTLKNGSVLVANSVEGANRVRARGLGE